MSDDKQPELTPAEQQQQDNERVQGQLIVTDVTRQMQGVMEAFGFGGSGSSGRTSFEGHELNAMIDLIENSNPEHLEEAGQALLQARTAINDAAKELGDFIKAVDWEGESGTAFRDWGNGLVAHATKLGEFAQAAGTQITVAGTGLASVRNSLPPRDTRLNRKSPDEIETPKRIDGNPEYAAALKVEKDRQEAINQANRLASYYAVSEETLAAQEPPRFEKKLDVAMPRPSERKRGDEESGGASSAGSGSSGSVGSGSVTGHAATGGQGPAASSPGYEAPVAVAPVPDKSVSTEIDSVATPPAPVTTTGPSPTPALTSPVGPSGGPTLTPPMATGFVNPVTSGSRVPQSATGAPKAVGQTGFGGPRASGPTVGGPAANGRTGPPVGRPAPVSGGPASGRGAQPPLPVGPVSLAAGPWLQAMRVRPEPPARVPAGQRPASSVGPRSAPSRAVLRQGRSWCPARHGHRSRGAPRPGGPVGGVGQRGVVGAGGASSASRPGGRGTPSTNGVVGTPRGGAVGSGAGSKGFTAGGAGLVRGPAGRRDSEDEDQDGGTPRPDYLTEDRETWEAGRRGVAPPVIE